MTTFHGAFNTERFYFEDVQTGRDEFGTQLRARAFEKTDGPVTRFAGNLVARIKASEAKDVTGALLDKLMIKQIDKTGMLKALAEEEE